MSAVAISENLAHQRQSRQATLAARRDLGAFYTPSSVTNVLCEWAIQSSSDVILEPSFGGCTFLESAIRRTKKLGQSSAKNIFGCDIDSSAFSVLRSKSKNLAVENFDHCDFLRWDGSKISDRKVDVVIGNPPYVRYSKLNEEGKETIEWWENKSGRRLSRLANLWAYFTYHALSFLREGGRLAWVLPASLLTAKYAEDLRVELSKRFRRIAYIKLTERIFLTEGTEERAVILLAEDFSPRNLTAQTNILHVEYCEGLQQAIARWANEASSRSEEERKSGRPSVSQIPIYGENRLNLHEFGELATVSIGAVTGNSKFFIKSLREWKEIGISGKHLKYIAPRSRWLSGLSLTSQDSLAHAAADVACFALAPPENPRALALLNYLGTYPATEIQYNATFSKRPKWFRFLEDEKPDALLAFMTHLGPKLVLNDVGVDATNSLYRVYFKSSSPHERKLIAISFQTSFTQLAAERAGRALGSGALKLEPRHFKSLPILLPQRSAQDIDATFNRIDAAVRYGNSDEARKIADNFIIGPSEFSSICYTEIDSQLIAARFHRRRNITNPEER